MPKSASGFYWMENKDSGERTDLQVGDRNEKGGKLS